MKMHLKSILQEILKKNDRLECIQEYFLSPNIIELRRSSSCSPQTSFKHLLPNRGTLYSHLLAISDALR